MPQLSKYKHERFAQLLARGLAPADAYTAAGYSASTRTIAVNSASRLMSNNDIRNRVTELQADTARSTARLNREFVLEALISNLSMAMGKSPISLIKYEKDKGWHSVEGYQYDGASAVRTLELLGKELSMFVDRKEIGGPGDFGRMTDEELKGYLLERYRLRKPLELTATEERSSQPETNSADLQPSQCKT